mmetsp:Transcript_4175/g.5479  ORF Transcript_4175/g.5479 Transcript_4175/m.5479 type:complete len:268 (-) Transcript_4175:220-1023(-)|eukprot:CAMPEP_0198144306 /NCGR_PEP_ID=MMETSP1443-20131203/14361_1 /TAXON_ID=186043 /ORGANISM="Entomoneis sp., Strain CCMP2396" /LENGTH=267 /DNA_ID=CAMNT_0043807669 /DNA_START=37 /DNA_END=840 /DNA_ORIENTATION=+
MSDTASFVDPVFLARFGLQRANVIDYFLHPLNPFRATVNTSNDVLAMQGLTIGILMQQGVRGEPLTPQAAEEEYQAALTRLTGEQYELLPPADPSMYMLPSPLYSIRHVLRTSPTSTKILGVYYVVEGVIYKAPAVRSLCKAHVAKTLGSLSSTFEALRKCTFYQPSLGYLWVFEEEFQKEGSTMGPVELQELARRRKRRKVLDHRRPGERTPAEEEGIRATEAMDQILVRLSRSSWVTNKASSKTSQPKESTTTSTPTKKKTLEGK